MAADGPGFLAGWRGLGRFWLLVLAVLGLGAAILRIIDHATEKRPCAEIVPTHDITLNSPRLFPRAAFSMLFTPLQEAPRKKSYSDAQP